MKKILFIWSLLISLNAIAQKTSNQFKSYYISSKHLTNERIVKFNQALIIEEIGNQEFTIQGRIGPLDNINSNVTFKKELSFAGSSYYEYEGKGFISGDRVSFAVESSQDLRNFTGGQGYKEFTNADLKLYEIHIFYWPYGVEEPLLKNNISIYPIANYEEAEQSNYIKGDGPKRLNVDYLLKREKLNSSITGIYDDEYHGRIEIVELNNNDVMFSLSFGAYGSIEGYSKIENKTIIYEENEFGECKLQLTFGDELVNLKSIGGNGSSDCGFGSSVFISNNNQSYVKISYETPDLNRN